MQAAAPEAVDISSRSLKRRRSFTASGSHRRTTLGGSALLARRLVERGVRFVQLYSGTHLGDDWDGAHNDLIGSHTEDGCKKTDQPIAGLC